MSAAEIDIKKPEADIDVGAQGIADAYAKALIEATEKAGRSEAVVGELDSWIDDVLAKNPKLDRLFASPVVDAEEKFKMVDRALPKAEPLFVKFLKVLASHERLEIIRPIRDEAHRILDKLRGRIEATVVSAVPMDSKQSAALQARLKTLLGGDVVLVEEVDPSLIGGLIVRVGDRVLDGSLSNSLARLKEQLINRSVHEIQRRRDSFSSPTGN
ncbi:MAG: ATP synthase F1 subunit delta [Planctomycetia bacterium]|nr:ATP synthase F1 subunit delta [Planctomycetia bacterium]